MKSEVLFHVELKFATIDLRNAQVWPPPPNPEVCGVEGLQDFLERSSLAEHCRDVLINRSIKPALRCILGAEFLEAMLKQCGENAIIRISLEKPNVTPS